MPNLPIPDKKIVTQQLRSLPPRIEAAKQKDLGEMMSKLKEVRFITAIFNRFFLADLFGFI